MRNKTYPLFTLFLFLSGLLFSQNSTQLTTDRLKFNEVGVEKAYIDWTGSDLFLINQESGDSDILMRAHNDLFFQTDALTRMTILKNGHVGIGLFDPIYPFQVDFSGQTGMLLRGDNTGDAQLRIENGGGNIHLLFDDFSEGNSLGIESSNEMLFNTNGANERMRIDDEGRVGIGTNMPLSPLHVEFTGAKGLRIRGDNTGDARLRIQNIGGGDHFIFDDISDSNALGVGSSGEMKFLSNGTNERMRIDSDGDIGIGTSTPSEKLDVKGDIALSSDAPTVTTISFKEAGAIQSYLRHAGSGLTLRSLNNLDNLMIESESDVEIITADDIRLRTGPSTRMIIHDDGDIGIGTTSTPNGKVEIRYNSSAGDPQLTLSEADASGFTRMTFENSSTGTDFWTIAAKATGSTNNPRFNVFYNDGTSGADYLSVDPASDNFIVRSDVIPSINTFDVGNILDGIDDSEAWDDVVAADYLAPSDRRVKQNIESIETVLPKLLQLNPVTYEYIPELNPDGRHRSGFIAQEVLKIFPDVVVNEDTDISDDGKGLQKKKSKYYTMNYMELIPITIKAIQEQQSQIEYLQTTNEELLQRLARIESLLSNAPIENRTEFIALTNAELKQNTPNPFTENTQIQFFIPESVKTASLQITDLNGKVLKNVVIQMRGEGQIELQANALSAGSYTYSLVLDGMILDTKQMVLTK